MNYLRTLFLAAVLFGAACTEEDSAPDQIEQCSIDLKELTQELKDLQSDYDRGFISFQEFVQEFNRLEAEGDAIMERCGL